ncbi:MAG: DUF1674 domain-containing protein [Alphaproteobacteria bacterium]|nr:DUF1674 domain-containing protein [Alphaproteobacteria bacterium]MBV9584382.1 DUF1674 domain-containing protein [Alphaproteobacteria bacterium]MBV9966474.1 DUF1674 domain-containing protein [Alphaproteobacteria bacterium]
MAAMTEKPSNAGEQIPPAAEEAADAKPPRPREIGGRKGPEPTRYGDREAGGRCIDF